MNGFEWNKIFGAVLLAALIASLTGFVASKIYGTGGHHGHDEKKGYVVAGVGEEHAADAGAAAVPAGPEPIEALFASASIEAGQKTGRACVACHTFEQGGANKVGPNLFGIVGAKHAHASGFAYSDAMKAKSGEAWTTDALNAYLFNPKAAVPGNKMAFAGIKNTQDRANLIAWLKTLK